MNREKVSIQPSPTHRTPTGASTFGGSGKTIIRLAAAVRKAIFRTANAADMRLAGVTCTANVAGVADGDWGVISIYGDHPSPDGSYVQHFSRDQAAKVVQTWNSITGVAARRFKNLWHGLGLKSTCPVWEGHPETDKRRWPKEKLLAEISDLRLGETGLEGCITWNAKGMESRQRGPLFPSSLWWHWPPSGDPPAVYPELLESVGLWPDVNIPGVPAWTANATLAGVPAAENQNQNEDMKHRDQLIALLGLSADATDAAIQSSLDAHGAKVTANASALSTANAAKADLENQLTTANGKVATLTGDLDAIKTANTNLVAERDGLKTANTALLAERDVLVTGALDLAEKKGAITPAERDAYKGKLTTANTAAATFTELQTRKAMNTDKVNINGNRVDLSTANARGAALDAAVAKHQADNKCDYDTAFAAVRANPDFATLFGAMQDPTKAAA